MVSTTQRSFPRPYLRRWSISLVLWGMVVGGMGCRSTGTGLRRRPPGQPIIRRVICMYDQRPWLNLDRLGDLDVEGFWFRMFLDPGTGRGTLAEGTMHIELYRIDRDGQGGAQGGATKRTLVSDWNYDTKELPRIAKPGMLGDGYVPQLVWADKALSGQEVDVVVSFEDAEGNIARAGTKRLLIPRYER